MRRELACPPHQLHGRVQQSAQLLEGKFDLKSAVVLSTISFIGGFMKTAVTKIYVSELALTGGRWQMLVRRLTWLISQPTELKMDKKRLIRKLNSPVSALLEDSAQFVERK